MITKISRMDRLPNFLRYRAPLARVELRYKTDTSVMGVRLNQIYFTIKNSAPVTLQPFVLSLKQSSINYYQVFATMASLRVCLVKRHKVTVAWEFPNIDSCTKRAKTETSRKIIADTIFHVTIIPIMSKPMFGRTFCR